MAARPSRSANMTVLKFRSYTWQGLAGQPRGQAIVSFMAIVESLPTYGVHYYEVRDKHGTTWWLGLSPQGIAVYPHHDKLAHLINPFCRRFLLILLIIFSVLGILLRGIGSVALCAVNKISIPSLNRKNPRRMYQWRQLENLYFREKKFSVEIHDQRRSNAQNQGR